MQEGGVIAGYRFPIEAGHVMMFARAIGDPNPVYYAGDPAVVVAPPTFVQASVQYDPDYPMRPKIGQPWFGSGRGPGIARGDAGRGGGLHAEQHYQYHRHPKPGDVLSVNVRPGRDWEKEGRRGGKLRFSESFVDYRDQHGDVVVTARRVSVRTERPATAG